MERRTMEGKSKKWRERGRRGGREDEGDEQRKKGKRNEK